MDKTDRDVLEAYVDKHQLTGVLEALIEICQDKSIHIAENWQDATLARTWIRAARRIDRLAILLKEQAVL